MKKFLFLSIFIAIFAISGFGQKLNYGTIEGKLMYPSEYIPAEMIVCVQNNSKDKTVCSNSKTKGYKFDLNHKAATYSVKLPVGKYFVFAAFPYGKSPTNSYEGYEAFYNEFVKCGLSVECKSHEKIEIEVKENETISEITPGDWYN